MLAVTGYFQDSHPGRFGARHHRPRGPGRIATRRGAERRRVPGDLPAVLFAVEQLSSRVKPVERGVALRGGRIVRVLLAYEFTGLIRQVKPSFQKDVFLFFAITSCRKRCKRWTTQVQQWIQRMGKFCFVQCGPNEAKEIVFVSFSPTTERQAS